MSTLANLLPEIVREAMTDGEVTEPLALLNALAMIDNPMMALAGGDATNALFSALYLDFAFLTSAKMPQSSLPPSVRERWLGLMRWVIRELRNWAVAEDPNGRKLAAIFVVTQANDLESDFWDLMPEDIGHNSEIVHCLKVLIASFSTGASTAGAIAPPIWERETVEAFQAADRDADWFGIGSRLHLIIHQFFPRPVLVQSVRCLHRCGETHLTTALASLRTVVVAIYVVNALRIDQRLIVASRSDNPYVEFAAVYQTVSDPRAHQTLSADDHQKMTDILLKIAADEPRWAAWMNVFNGFPVRYPALQVPLGAALASAPASAINAYIEAVSLFAYPVDQIASAVNRPNIVLCLRHFRASAPPEMRIRLWTKAYERWLAWDFGRKQPQSHLTDVCRSDLDYAIVGFAIECKDDAGRAEIIRQLYDRLRTLEDEWHSSVTDIISEFRRIISALQPFARASAIVGNGNDWIDDSKLQLPFQPSNNKYFMMRYQSDFRDAV